MNNELKEIIKQINNYKKPGTIIFSNKEDFDIYEDKIKEIFKDDDYLYFDINKNLKNYSDFKYFKQIIQSSKTIIASEFASKAIIFIKDIQDIASVNPNVTRDLFLDIINKPLFSDDFYLVMQSSNKNLDKSFLENFNVIDNMPKTLDDLLKEGRTFKDINKVFKDISER